MVMYKKHRWKITSTKDKKENNNRSCCVSVEMYLDEPTEASGWKVPNGEKERAMKESAESGVQFQKLFFPNLATFPLQPWCFRILLYPALRFPQAQLMASEVTLVCLHVRRLE